MIEIPKGYLVDITDDVIDKVFPNIENIWVL